MKEQIKYIESSAIYDFGYFRIVENFFGLRTFTDLEDYSGSPGFWPIVMKLTRSGKDDIPLEIELPSRPPADVNFGEINLSLAELAGVATFIKFITGKKGVLFGYTYLGRYARRWFNVVELPGAPKSERDGWILQARGEKQFNKMDKIPSLVYKKTEDLQSQFRIETKDAKRITLGGLKLEFMDKGLPEVRKIAEMKREDLHTFLGFWKAFSSYSFNQQRTISSLNLVDSPLLPYSQDLGRLETGKLLGIDRITSFI